jgi:hypothetical protein
MAVDQGEPRLQTKVAFEMFRSDIAAKNELETTTKGEPEGKRVWDDLKHIMKLHCDMLIWLTLIEMLVRYGRCFMSLDTDKSSREDAAVQRNIERFLRSRTRTSQVHAVHQQSEQKQLAAKHSRLQKQLAAKYSQLAAEHSQLAAEHGQQAAMHLRNMRMLNKMAQ